MPEPILIAQHGQTQCFLQPDKANRHGLITGATGTGKTITLQTLAEGFSKLGVPVFMADVKGDLTGLGDAEGRLGKVAAAAVAPRFFSTVRPATIHLFRRTSIPTSLKCAAVGPSIQEYKSALAVRRFLLGVS